MSAAEILTIRTVPAATMAPAPAVPKPLLTAVALIVAVLSGILLGLTAAARNECRKTADILPAPFMAALGWLRIRLLLVLRTIVHLLIAWWKWLSIARQIRLLLRFPRRVARLILAHELIVVFVPIERVIAADLRLAAGRAALLMRLLLIVIRVLLTKLFLRGGDQAEIVLGVLIIILGGHRIA